MKSLFKLILTIKVILNGEEFLEAQLVPEVISIVFPYHRGVGIGCSRQTLPPRELSPVVVKQG